MNLGAGGFELKAAILKTKNNTTVAQAPAAIPVSAERVRLAQSEVFDVEPLDSEGFNRNSPVYIMLKSRGRKLEASHFRSHSLQLTVPPRALHSSRAPKRSPTN